MYHSRDDISSDVAKPLVIPLATVSAGDPETSPVPISSLIFKEFKLSFHVSAVECSEYAMDLKRFKSSFLYYHQLKFQRTTFDF